MCVEICAYENPSASEIIIWSKEAGYGIPTPDPEALRAEVAWLCCPLGEEPDRAQQRRQAGLDTRRP